VAADSHLTADLDRLIDLFNRRSMDLPDGLLTRNTQFILNGIPFEERLGRSPDDPLVRMLARGPAGYRFAAKALQHALPDATIQRGDLQEQEAGGERLFRAQCWIAGHYRGTGEEAHLLVSVDVSVRDGAIARMSATLDEAPLVALQAARLRP
jgi:hypothetical protein